MSLIYRLPKLLACWLQISPVYFKYKIMVVNDHQGMADIDLRGMVARVYVEDYYKLLYTKSVSCGTYGLREDFSKIL